ncbi:hypothetical protein D3C83_230740 [compost metagenome]
MADVILLGDYTGHSFFTERPDLVAIEIAQGVAHEARGRIGRRSQTEAQQRFGQLRRADEHESGYLVI